MGLRGRSSKEAREKVKKMPPPNRNYRWYVLYTRCKHEEAAEAYLKRSNIEVYLPMHEILKQWSDRKKQVMVPLFPSYLFVRISCLEYDRALQDKSISGFVTFGGSASAVPDEQIEAIKIVLNKKVGFEITNESFIPGHRVTINSGPLSGFPAEVIDRKGKKRLILRVESTSQAMLITTDCSYVD